MNNINYFEVLRIKDPAAIDDAGVREAKSKALSDWTNIELNSVSNDERRHAKQMRLLIDEAYAALADAQARKEYLEELEGRKQRATFAGGQIQIQIRREGKFGNLNFNVIENPVVHPLYVGGMQIRSIQEFVCRAWENPDEVGLPLVGDRSIERWLYYSAAEKNISNMLKYYAWKSNDLSEEQMLLLILDLLQARYPVPIIPRSAPYVFEKLEELDQPRWMTVPAYVNLDLLPNKPVNATVTVRSWKKHTGKLNATCDNPNIQLDMSQLNRTGQLNITVNGEAIKTGEAIRGTITLISEAFGKLQVPVYGVRLKWLGIKSFNQGLLNEHNLLVAGKAREANDLETAAQLYREAGSLDQARDTERAIIAGMYRRHEWLRLIEKGREFQMRYGRDAAVTSAMVEALRLIGGTLYQLNQQERALPYLATLTLETNYLPDKRLPEKAWTARPEAQVEIDPVKPRKTWIEVAEKLDLRWTHPGGTVDKSHYAGTKPIELRDRAVYWRTPGQYRPHLIASLGVLVARRSDYSAVVGLDAGSGTVIWEHRQGMTGRPMAQPVSNGKQVFFADPAGVVYALDMESGKVRWQTPMEDSRDLNLAVMNDTLVVATGTQVIVVGAKDGAVLNASRKMKGMFAGANPVNVIVSDNCILFQKGTMTRKTINFLDIASNQEIEYQMPFGAPPPIAWAAHEGEVYIPFLRRYKGDYPDGATSDGRQKYSTVRWEQVFIAGYNVHSSQALVQMETPIPGQVYYQPGSNWRLDVSQVPADIVAIAPVSILGGEQLVIAPYEPGEPLNYIIAAAFGNRVLYWIRFDDRIEIANTRKADGNVQSLLFASIQDIIITDKSMSASLIGQTDNEYALTVQIPNAVRPLVGAPALYGDVMFVVSSSGEISALAR